MIVQIGSGNSGWSQYVLYGTKAKPRDPRAVRIIEGDTELGDAIGASTNYKTGQYIRMVLSFDPDDEITPEQAASIAKEFVKDFMNGYGTDEYHVDIVEHTDTDHLHYHIRITKLNLKTGTQLMIYNDKTDRHRKQLIVDHLHHKYNLIHPDDKRKLRPAPGAAIERITKWRKEHGQRPVIDLSTKKKRAESVEAIENYIEEMHAAQLIDSIEELREAVKELDLEIVKEDFDRGKEFHYFTVRPNGTDKKIRLKGEHYGRKFWENNRENRAAAFGNNRAIREGFRRDPEHRERIGRELKKALERREKQLDKRYRTARQRAEREDRERVAAVQRDDHESFGSGAEPRRMDTDSFSDDNGISPWGRVNMGIEPPKPSRSTKRNRDRSLHTEEKRVDAGRDRQGKKILHRERRVIDADDEFAAEIARRAGAQREARKRAIRNLHDELDRDYQKIREDSSSAAQAAREREVAAFRSVAKAGEFFGSSVKALGGSIDRFAEVFKNSIGELHRIRDQVAKRIRNITGAAQRVVERIEEERDRWHGYGMRR